MIGPGELFVLLLGAAFVRSRFPAKLQGSERIAGQAPPKPTAAPRRASRAHEAPAVTIAQPQGLAEIRAQLATSTGAARETLLLMEDDAIAASPEYQSQQEAEYEAWLLSLNNPECNRE